MLPLPRFWAIACRVPFLFRGDALHRAALMLVFQRRFELADRLFEAAAHRYRAELEIPSLARLRVHQLIARAQAAREKGREAALELVAEIERRLSRLEDLEDLAPPFAMIDADDGPARWNRVESASAAGAA
jgi:hypothetical protein